MSIATTTRAKAQAAVSKAQAEVIEITTELKRKQTALSGSDAAGELLDTVADTPLIGPLTGGLRGELDVDAARLRAEVDELAARLASAQSRLSVALRAQSAITAVLGPQKVA